MRTELAPRIAVIIFFSIALLLEMSPGTSAWNGLAENSEHLTILYHPEDARVATNLVAFAEMEYRRVTEIIGHRSPEIIQVYVAKDREEFHLLTQSRIPEWGIGAAVPAMGRIVLISPRHAPGDISLRQILAHELSHVILGRALKNARAPRWLDEGLAMYISHEWKLGQSVLVARALLFDSLISLEDIDAVNSFSSSRANLAYAESFLAVAFIIDQHGEASLHQLIRELARHGDVDQAMRISLGMTYREFLLVWRDYVTNRFNWASTLSNPLVLWMAILFLFVLVFVLKRRHSRRVMERWKLAEDGLGDLTTPEGSEERWSRP